MGKVTIHGDARKELQRLEGDLLNGDSSFKVLTDICKEGFEAIDAISVRRNYTGHVFTCPTVRAPNAETRLRGLLGTLANARSPRRKNRR